MTLVLELTATQETELRRRADAVGLSPSDYLLSAAQIGTSTGNLTEQKAGDLPKQKTDKQPLDLAAYRLPQQNASNLPQQNASNLPQQNASDLPQQNASNLPIERRRTAEEIDATVAEIAAERGTWAERTAWAERQ